MDDTFGVTGQEKGRSTLNSADDRADMSTRCRGIHLQDERGAKQQIVR